MDLNSYESIEQASLINIKKTMDAMTDIATNKRHAKKTRLRAAHMVHELSQGFLRDKIVKEYVDEAKTDKRTLRSQLKKLRSASDDEE